MNLESFIRRCHDIYNPGTIQDFDRNPRRQRYFNAWMRAIRLKNGVSAETTKERLHRQYGWAQYLAADMRLRNE